MTQALPLLRMRSFLILWIGQFASLTGSALTGFALGVWVYQQTQSVTLFTLVMLSSTLPGVVAGPVIGVLVDRLDRRTGMMLSEGIAGIATLALMPLLFANQLQVWHIALATAIISLCSAFQWSAYGATIPLLVPQQRLGQANGMVQVAQAVGQIAAPTAASLLMTVAPIQWILLIDVSTFLCAILTLFVIKIPQVPRERTVAPSSFRAEIAYGWQYIAARAGLFGLLIFLAVTNGISTFVQVLLTPFVLNIASPQMLGLVLSAAGVGMLAGGILISVWGGPRRRMQLILGGTLLRGLLLLLAGLPPSVLVIGCMAAAYMFLFPFIASGSQSIWQGKVDPAVQGRVFATRYMVSTIATPLAYLLAGPLIDLVFEPSLVPGGPLAGSIGLLLGTGAGRGFALLFIVLGVTTLIAVALAYRNPHVRNLDIELSDALRDVDSIASTEPIAST